MPAGYALSIGRSLCLLGNHMISLGLFAFRNSILLVMGAITSSFSALIISNGRGDMFCTKLIGSMMLKKSLTSSETASIPNISVRLPPASAITGTFTLSSTPEKMVPITPPRLMPKNPIRSLSISVRLSRKSMALRRSNTVWATSVLVQYL